MKREEEIDKASREIGKPMYNEDKTVHEIFCAAAQWADAHPINPWHKASEELPMYDVPVIVTYDGNTDDCCFNHRSNNPEVKTTEHDWCEIGYEGEPTHWMYIPEIK